jgi:hypothetical protein
MYGHGTELYLSAKPKGGFNVTRLARRLAALPPAFDESDWPEAEISKPEPVVYAPPASLLNSGANAAAALRPVEIIQMSDELAAALRHQREIDISAAGPQAPSPSAIYRGVEVSSRWSIAHELGTMRDIVDALPAAVRARVESIWCDSNANADYAFTIQAGRWFDGIDYHIRDAVRGATSGFNGLAIRGDGNDVSFNPEWEGDDFDYGGDALAEPVPADWDDEPL